MTWQSSSVFPLLLDAPHKRPAPRLPARRTKGKEPKSITLDSDLLKLIDEQRKLHDKKFPSCEYVFPDAEGKQVSYDRAIDRFQAACKRAGTAEGFTT